jgi:hypothetical protein
MAEPSNGIAPSATIHRNQQQKALRQKAKKPTAKAKNHNPQDGLPDKTIAFTDDVCTKEHSQSIAPFYAWQSPIARFIGRTSNHQTAEKIIIYAEIVMPSAKRKSPKGLATFRARNQGASTYQDAGFFCNILRFKPSFIYSSKIRQ